MTSIPQPSTLFAPDVEVRVSTRRKKTAGAHWEGDRIVVVVPSHLRGSARDDMVEHLTRPEIAAVVVAGGREALGGAGLAIGGLALTAVSLSSGGQIVLVFSGMFVAGLGMIFHGLHRRTQAKIALARMPDARVVG